MNDIAKKLFEEAEKLIKNGRYREAIPKLLRLKRLTQRDGEQEEVLYNLGLSYLMLNRFTRAADIFKRLSRSNPDSALYYYMLGLANLKRADLKEALWNFKKANHLSPTEKEFTRKYGWTLCLMGKRRGEKILENLFQQDVSDTDVAVDYILCLLKNKKIEKAKWITELNSRYNPASPELEELRMIIEKPERISEMFVSFNELKTLAILMEQSNFDETLFEEVSSIFLGLKGKLYKRIKKPEVWAASLEFLVKFLKGKNMDREERLIAKKYKVEIREIKRKVSQMMEVLLNG